MSKTYERIFKGPNYTVTARTSNGCVWNNHSSSRLVYANRNFSYQKRNDTVSKVQMFKNGVLIREWNRPVSQIVWLICVPSPIDGPHGKVLRRFVGATQHEVIVYSQTRSNATGKVYEIYKQDPNDYFGNSARYYGYTSGTFISATTDKLISDIPVATCMEAKYLWQAKESCYVMRYSPRIFIGISVSTWSDTVPYYPWLRDDESGLACWSLNEDTNLNPEWWLEQDMKGVELY